MPKIRVGDKVRVLIEKLRGPEYLEIRRALGKRRVGVVTGIDKDIFYSPYWVTFRDNVVLGFDSCELEKEQPTRNQEKPGKKVR